MMTFEALLTLSFSLVIVAGLLVFSAMPQVNDIVYRQQVCQDVAEVIWLSGASASYGEFVEGNFASGEAFRGKLAGITDETGWCIRVRLASGESEIRTCDAPKAGTEMITVTRTLVRESGFRKIMVSTWKK